MPSNTTETSIACVSCEHLSPDSHGYEHRDSTCESEACCHNSAVGTENDELETMIINDSPAASAQKAGELLVKCECCGRSSDHDCHHHLYWVTHGKGVPLTKVKSNCVVLMQFYATVHFAVSAEVVNRDDAIASMQLRPQPNLLTTLGQLRI